MLKRLLSALLATLLTFSLAGCQENDLNIPDGQTGTDDFQKNLHQTDKLSFLETDAGYYFSWSSLYYLDKDTMKVTEVCGKPDCDHTDDAICNARIHADYLLTGGERIYYIGYDHDPKTVGSVKYDATGRETVQELKFNEFSASQSSYDQAIYHRGYVYYISDDILYRVKLGGEKDSAEEIWKPEDAGSAQAHAGGMIDFNPNAIHYTLWADGDTLYFMANVQASDGTYKDVLFQCGLNGSDVKQIWVTPGAEDVGEWEKTGVSVSQWYIMDGYIYFFLAGNGLWRTELSSGKNEKLAETSEKTQYGSAIFSDDYMCLVNDYPVLFYGYTEPQPGGMFRYYGDTIFVYGLDGEFKKEIPLGGLYEDPAEMAQIDLLFCSGNEVYFLTTGMSLLEGAGPYAGLTGHKGDINLCRADIETGEVEMIYTLREGT